MYCMKKSPDFQVQVQLNFFFFDFSKDSLFSLPQILTQAQWTPTEYFLFLRSVYTFLPSTYFAFNMSMMVVMVGREKDGWPRR